MNFETDLITMKNGKDFILVKSFIFVVKSKTREESK